MRQLFEEIQSYRNQWSAVWEQQVGSLEADANGDWSPKQSDRLENDCYTTEDKASPPENIYTKGMHDEIKKQATPSKSLGPSQKLAPASNSIPAGVSNDDLHLTEHQRKELQTVLLSIQALEFSSGSNTWKP